MRNIAVVFPLFVHICHCVKLFVHIYLGQNTSKYCSQLIVVHVHANVFSKVHPACHNITNGIKSGSNSKKTDKHAADCSKAVCWGVK